MGNRRRRRITLERKEIINRRSKMVPHLLKEKKKDFTILLSTRFCSRFQVLSGASLWQIDGRQCRALDPFSILASAQL